MRMGQGNSQVDNKTSTPNSDLPNFKCPFNEDEIARMPKTFLDTNILFLKQNIVGKPKWYEKVSNLTIVSKWRREAKTKMSDEEVQYVIDWLMYEVAQQNSNPFKCILSTPVDAVYIAEKLIPDDLKKAFIKHASMLENIPEDQRDYHPGSNDTVWDIIHPSLFCLTYDVSHAVKTPISQRDVGMSKWIGTSDVKLVSNSKVVKDSMSSQRYQWLPSEIAVDKHGKVKINSYINNLHPYKHRELYFDMSQILERFVPLWERVLAESLQSDVIQNVDMYNLYGDQDEDEDHDEDDDERIPRPIKLNTIFQPKEIKNSVDLKGRNLQVIVKMANIELTPQNPKYEGGTWHVEGMKNENIVATGIYYYNMSNITQTNLQFRQACQDPDYEQCDYNGVRYVFGLENEQPLNQYLGEVTLFEDRCIAFPNIYQHLVTPFKLVDPNQNGHRKILVFFLIDPKKPVVSTSTVLPQQKEWFLDAFIQTGSLGSLPKDIVEHIIGFMPNLMSMEEAKGHRTKLMDERKFIRKETDDQVFLREFSLCEH